MGVGAVQVHDNSETFAEEERSEGEVEIKSTVSPSHKLTLKCIGATKAVEYQSALRVVCDLMTEGRSVWCTSLANQETPGHWLLFVRLKTIG